MPLHLICMHEPDIHFPEIGLQNNFKMFSPHTVPQSSWIYLPCCERTLNSLYGSTPVAPKAGGITAKDINNSPITTLQTSVGLLPDQWGEMYSWLQKDQCPLRGGNQKYDSFPSRSVPPGSCDGLMRLLRPKVTEFAVGHFKDYGWN